ncbi:MAG: TetR/AcrR family transcriptional regulator [Rhodobacteraceae bacterium]|nr:TetR/AcrR family transcriptional regulator [Paracoccaceae bacterium]
MARVTPLHRDDPDKEPLAGNVRVTKQDWLNVALDTLITDGIEQVKVLALADRMSVSRSSFYWYFKSRQDLLDALLDHWLATNTKAIITAAEKDARTVTEAVCNIFIGFVDPNQFSTTLDFAIRDWARRSGKVRRVIDTSDAQRLAAITQVFERFGYPSDESLIRAKVLYYMQIGYNDADLQEPMDARQSQVGHYIHAFTGQHASEAELTAFRAAIGAFAP